MVWVEEDQAIAEHTSKISKSESTPKLYSNAIDTTSIKDYFPTEVFLGIVSYGWVNSWFVKFVVVFLSGLLVMLVEQRLFTFPGKPTNENLPIIAIELETTVVAPPLFTGFWGISVPWTH